MGRKNNRHHNNNNNKNQKNNYVKKQQVITFDELNDSTKEKYTEFMNTTLDKDTFIIQNVAEDNACFYRSISNGLFNIVDSEGDTGGEILYSIGNWKSDINGHKTVSNKFWGYKGSEQTYLAKKIQQIAKQWLIDNSNKYVNGIPGYRVVDLVRDSHEFNIDNDAIVMALYDICYSKFAGAPRSRKLGKLVRKRSESMSEPEDFDDEKPESFDSCVIESDDEDNEVNIQNNIDEPENNDFPTTESSTETLEDSDMDIDDESEDNITSYDVYEEEDFGFRKPSNQHERIKQKILGQYPISEMWDRWGSGAEAYALSVCFGVPIIIYAAKRFNFKNGHIENGRLNKGYKPDKNVRFQVLQQWGAEFMDTTPPIELLYKKIRGNVEHYMVLYRNE